MREIKFRGRQATAWWEFGDLGQDTVGHCRIYPPSDRHHGGTPVIPATVGQYTGNESDRGEEVYEGDIVQLTSDGLHLDPPETEVFVVAWSPDACGFWLRSFDGEMIEPYEGCDCVLGNVHDNPELIEVEDETV